MISDCQTASLVAAIAAFIVVGMLQTISYMMQAKDNAKKS